MNRAIWGVLCALIFVSLESLQFVFFGGLFQRMDSFLIGVLVFGGTAAGAIGLTLLRRPAQLRIALANPGTLLVLNLCAAGGWIAYLLAVQLIEPAVAFTLFCGAVPLTTLVAALCGMPEASFVRNWIEACGAILIALGLAVLIAITLAGWSGFVRGGVTVALGGLALGIASGAFIAFLMLYARRLDIRGVGPMAQYGLRFPLYLVLSLGGVALGLDAKGEVPLEEIALAAALGLFIMAFPIYAMQRAVSLVPTLTIGAMTSLGPLFVFGFQIIEGRVAHAPATLLGLSIYFAGALLAAFGGSRAEVRGERAARTAV